MVSTSRRSNQERREQSTELVLASALKLFVSRGYRATSIDDIARQAGLTKGAVYFYFKGKSALLVELIAQSCTLYQGIFTRMQTSRLNASAQLELFVDWAAEVGALNNELLLLPILMSTESGIGDEEVERALEQLYDRFHTEMERVVCQGRDEGEFIQDVFPTEQAAVLVAFTDGMLLEWFRRSDRLSGRNLIQSAKTLLIGGLRGR
ncbi:MAG: TetR/AcrR family transcriptional regulator [Halioglobus sp.]